MFIFNPLSRSAYVCEAQRDDSSIKAASRIDLSPRAAV